MTHRRAPLAMVVLLIVALPLTAFDATVGAAGPEVGEQSQSTPRPVAEEQRGASIAEKIAFVYLLVGGSIMLYYGPTEKENGSLTRDGLSEAIGGAAAIGISFGLLRDIVKKRRRAHRPPPAPAAAPTRSDK